MSTSLLILVTLIYFGVALNETRTGNHPTGLVFAAYGVANIGLIWQMRVSG